jgi:hypothetical protein
MVAVVRLNVSMTREDLRALVRKGQGVYRLRRSSDQVLRQLHLSTVALLQTDPQEPQIIRDSIVTPHSGDPQGMEQFYWLEGLQEARQSTKFQTQKLACCRYDVGKLMPHGI